MGQFATIASFRDLPMAEIAKSRLEADGLECRLANEYMVSVNWLYSNALGGVEVQVRQEDVERAREILADEGSEAVPDELEHESAEIPGDRCERCGSSNIGIVQTSTWAGIASVLIGIFLLGLPFIFHRKRYRCTDCGYVNR